MLNNSLKEYYIKLTEMYNRSLSMIEAMNQSLTSNSSEVSVTVNMGNEETVLRIPSVLYLENKLEELENNFNNLFNMPSSGEAWFNNNSNLYKLELIKSNSAPVTPVINTSVSHASITDNNFLKDLVSPKTYFKVNISNLPENISEVFMKKIIFYNSSVFTNIKNLHPTTYEEYRSILYSLQKGIDYDEYDSTLSLPVKKDTYSSRFVITDKLEEFTDPITGKVNYKLTLDTLQYHDQEDSSIEYTLKQGDEISLQDQLVVFKVKNVNVTNMSVDIEEQVGHIRLLPYNENPNMILLYHPKQNEYDQYHSVEIPLEENQYICIFIGLIYNNVRSLFSEPILLDLSTIYMYDKYDNPITDSNGNHMTYMEYYDKYCTNIGDLILGISEIAYPQTSNLTNDVLSTLQTSDEIKNYVYESFAQDGILEVVPINKHLIDDVTTEDLINLHAQKGEINSQLLTIQENINNVYSKLVNTDFNQEVNITQESLRSQLDGYYSERTTMQKQLNAIVDNINTIASDVTIARQDTKYRIRGITVTKTLEDYIHALAGEKVDVIGIECEYKYKSTSKDTTTITTINSNVFSDWNKQDSIDRQRKLVFNSTTSSFKLEFEDYSSTQNIIKWNQIDIPIVQGEDVVVRLRYKYNIGQPYINLYSPWSDELVVVFPAEFSDNVQLKDILEQNDDDVVTSKFSQTLINEGYQEHITNSIKSNNAVFYHLPENIYSGFNTPENNLISLKDKLSAMNKDIENAKAIIDSEFNKKYEVYLTYNTTNVKLQVNNINKINIYNTEHISDSFVHQSMNIVIRNTGDTNLRFYSIFPGNVDVPLLLSGNEFYEQYIRHYERVPIFVDNIMSYQTLGQWIYFRQDNPYTYKSIYYDSSAQDLQDYRTLTTASNKMTFTSINTYMKKDYEQVLLGYRKRNTGEIKSMVESTWIGLDYKGNGVFEQFSDIFDLNESTAEQYRNKGIDFFIYEKDLSNNYLARFEDICGLNNLGNTIYLDRESSISEFIARNTVNGVNPGTNTFIGAFLYPDITGRSSILTNGAYNDYIEIEVGKSISIPITFEYYIDGESVKNITKALYFDLRDSLVQEVQHFMIELVANYDYTSTGSLINSTSLIDEATKF